MDAEYKIGDLIILNDFGRLVLDDNKKRIGLVVSGPRNIVYPLFSAIEEDPLRFWAYDIMIGGELITGVPQEFIDSWNEDKTI